MMEGKRGDEAHSPPSPFVPSNGCFPHHRSGYGTSRSWCSSLRYYCVTTPQSESPLFSLVIVFFLVPSACISRMVALLVKAIFLPSGETVGSLSDMKSEGKGSVVSLF